jgi:mycothiol synthase
MRWPGDAEALLRLLGDGWRVGRPRVSLHPADLVWRQCLRASRDLRIWETSAGEAVGLVELDAADSSCDIAVRPDLVEPLERELFSWAEEEARRRGSGETFTVGCFDGNEPRAALLRELGFESTEDFYPHFLRPLDRVPEVRPVEGYAIRPLRDDELEERVELGRLASGQTSLTPEKLAALRRGPGYDPEFDLVAVDGAGRLAAFTLCWLDAENGLGQLEPVGCHPEHRRRGLARAAIEEGLRRMRERGAREVLVVTGGGNAGARALYESIGFDEVGRDRDWVKALA